MESQNTVADRENVIVCPFCGHNNEPEASRCVQCWSRVEDIEAVTKEEGVEITKKIDPYTGGKVQVFGFEKHLV